METIRFVYSVFNDSKAAKFLEDVIASVPYKIHTILTDNGSQFTNRKQDKQAVMHIFDRICMNYSIEHRLTKICHPWTNGQVEPMNRTLKEATVKKYYYKSHQLLKQHLYDFVMLYNFSKRLKAIKGLTPYEKIINAWKFNPQYFNINPSHHILGLNT